MKSFKISLGLILSIVLGMLVLAGCSRNNEEVYVSAVAKKPLQAFIFANGVVRSQEVDEIFVDSGTRIINVLVQEGATVNANQTLFTYGSNRSATSSIDGVVTNLNIRRGMEVSFSDPAVVVMNLNRLKIKADVPQTDIARVLHNQSVEITAKGVLEDRVLEGKVDGISRVAKSVDDQVFVEVDIIVEGIIPNDLRPGMKVMCNILMRETQDAIVVGMDSVVPVGNDNFVYVVRGGELEEREVNLGVRAGYDYEVISGLDEGEIIVRNPMPYFYQGMPVSVVN